MHAVIEAVEAETVREGGAEEAGAGTGGEGDDLADRGRRARACTRDLSQGSHSLAREAPVPGARKKR